MTRQTMHDLLLYESAKAGTGTSRGMSYWAVASACGRKSNLIQLHRQVYEAMESSDIMSIGTYYHFLQDAWAEGKIPDDGDISIAEIEDAEWAEATRLFNFYRQNRTLDYFGKIIGSEVTIPVDDTHRACIAKFMGMDVNDPDVPTGQMDRLVYLEEDDVDRIEDEHELVLRGPGLYIHDHKTSGTRKSIESIRADWTDTVQALAYPVLYNLGPSHLGRVKGMIFDGIIKHRNLRAIAEGKNGASLQVGFAPYSEENDDIVRAAILEAKFLRDRNKANPYACYNKFGKPCAFLENGVCERK